MWEKYKNKAQNQNFNHQQDGALATPVFSQNPVIKSYWLDSGWVICIDNLFENIQAIKNTLESFTYSPVSEDGIASAWQEGRIKVSGRASLYDIDFSEKMTQALNAVLPEIFLNRFLNANGVNAKGLYEFIAINPYLRLVKYELARRLQAHYDGHYHFDDKIQTVMTCLIYLNDCQTGEITFLKDNSALSYRIAHKNSVSQTETTEILRLAPKAGRVLLFDQYLLHETTLLIEPKNLILTDFIMQKMDKDKSI